MRDDKMSNRTCRISSINFIIHRILFFLTNRTLIFRKFKIGRKNIVVKRYWLLTSFIILKWPKTSFIQAEMKIEESYIFRVLHKFFIVNSCVELYSTFLLFNICDCRFPSTNVFLLISRASIILYFPSIDKTTHVYSPLWYRSLLQTEPVWLHLTGRTLESIYYI